MISTRYKEKEELGKEKRKDLKKLHDVIVFEEWMEEGRRRLVNPYGTKSLRVIHEEVGGCFSWMILIKNNNNNNNNNLGLFDRLGI